jgi:DNA damage-binding protein 1
LEIRQLKVDEVEEGISSPFPVILSVPINGRITSLAALPLASHPTSLLFLTTDQHQYAVIGYKPDLPNYMQTYASGSLKDEWNVLGAVSECGPLVAVDPHNRCIAMHLYDGLVTIFPINNNNNNNNNQTNSVLGPVFHARLEERTVLQLTMLHHMDASATPPHLCLLHQDSRGAQHISTHVVDLPKSQLWSMTSLAGNQTMAGKHVEWLKKSRIDGGSSLLIPVPPSAAAAAAASSSATSATTTNQPSGGVVILGQRQITFCALNHYKVMPIPPALLLSWDVLPRDVSGMPRFLLGDEFGNLHMLTLITQNSKVIALQLDTLGSCTLSNTLQYLDHGLVFCGSTLGDSQLVQIHDEPIPVEEEYMEDDAALELGETTYLSVEEEYTHLGPIVDFDLVPMAGSNRSEGVQSRVVTASGSSKSGSLRVVQNGIGMKEYASVELSGIQNMWSLRQKFDDTRDAYLVQSFVGETRVLGVTSAETSAETSEQGGDAMKEDEPAGDSNEMMTDEEVGGTLEEVFLPGLESSASTLFVTNVVGDLFLQITETQLRLANAAGEVLDTIEPQNQMTVATANEAGQVAVALRGGNVLYVEIADQKLRLVASKQMDREVSCLDINPFLGAEISTASLKEKRAHKSAWCAVGLWDDFTVRLLSLESKELPEVLLINLSTEDEDSEIDANSGEKRRSNRNNMMARSLCLITLDLSSSSSNSNDGIGNNNNNHTKGPGVDMLFVGLGDGTLVSFAVVREDGMIRVQSKKEVSLGTQRINLIPLQNERGGSCVLATGDRPTVIYLAGASSANYNPKLCYSNVNLSPAEEGDTNDVSQPHTQESISVNVATPFFSPLLFDAMGQEHYSLCVADDAILRLGVIDDIQKLHVSTHRLGMAPRRIVHCPEGNMFAVGCIESGIKQVSGGGGEMTMGNCIRFLDDTTFEDIER